MAGIEVHVTIPSLDREVWRKLEPGTPPPRAYDKEGARSACRPFLEAQLIEQAPRLVLALGNVALQTFLGDPEAEVKGLRGRVLSHGGRPLLCSYHPLAARRRPNLYPLLVEDFWLANRYLQAPENIE